MAVGSTVRDILLNRKADEYAKQTIQNLANQAKAELGVKEVEVFARQLWLAKLNRTCKKPDDAQTAVPAVPTAPAARLTPRQLCPRWAWDSVAEHYTWSVYKDDTLAGSNKPPLSAANFRTFLRFTNSLRWKVGDGLACSVFELAVFAFMQGWRFELAVGTLCSLQAYATIIRAAISFCKQKYIVVAPLLLDKGNKCNGKTHPKGAFFGAEVFLDNPTLECLCRAF